MFCRIDGANRRRAWARKPRASPRQFVDIARVRPTLGLEHVHERLEQQRFDRVQLLASHALDLLDDVHPVRPFIDRFARGDPPQQIALALAPQQDVVVVQVAHGPHPSTMAMSGAAGFFMPTIW